MLLRKMITPAAIGLLAVAGVYADGQGNSDTKMDETTASSNEAQREKIWNSADMLHARAWLEDYFRVSKKYTPEQAQEYRKHLKNLNAKQMELWLMKFDHERDTVHKQQAMWDHQRSMNVARDLAAIRHTHTTLNDINRQENVAAAQDQQKLQAQQGFSERMYRQRQAEQSAYERDLNARPAGLYGGRWSPNYHFHMYP
jgi:hypothetical protein